MGEKTLYENKAVKIKMKLTEKGEIDLSENPAIQQEYKEGEKETYADR